MAETEKPKARAKGKRRPADKWKRKAWYTILAPEEFDRKEIGRTPAMKPELVKGRVLAVSARDIANQPKKQQVTIKFKVQDVRGDKAYAIAAGHEIREIHIKRMLRRRNSKVEVVQDVTAKDGTRARVKSVVITARRATRSQSTAMWKVMKERVGEFCSKKESQNLIAELVFGNLPNLIFKDVKRVLPVKRVEIVKSALLSK